jgi:cbb3-type cytochrome oxidase maturation protein
MSVLWVLVGASVLVAFAFLIIFIWAVRNGQYDDNYTPSVRILFEDNKKNSHIDTASPPTNAEGSNPNGDANRNVRQ